MKLVDGARGAWKWYSMHAMGWPVALITTWLLMPAAWQSLLLGAVPPNVLLGVIAAVLVAGMVGRLAPQTPST
jgi:hypothetical protein